MPGGSPPLRGRDPRFQIGLALVLGLFGFLVATGFVQERVREEHVPSRMDELEALVSRRQDSVAELAARVKALSDQVSEARQQAGRDSALIRGLNQRLSRAERVAGLAPVHGPGLVVELADSPRTARTRAELVDLRIQDVDLQRVANALWRAGAEAVAVNDQRVVATTAIRTAGNAILVNYRAVASPYRVTAIGDPDQLRWRLSDSEVVRRFEVWSQVYGLRFSIDRDETLSAPALRGLSKLRWAQPVEEG